MKSKFNEKYAKIKSMEELRLERTKMHAYLDMMEEDLREDYDEIKSMFSISYIVSKAVSSISARTSLIDRFSMGYGVISDLLKRRKSKKHSHSREICE